MRNLMYPLLASTVLAAAPASAAEFLAQIGSPGCSPVSSGISNAPVAVETVCNPVPQGSLDAQASASFGHVGGTSKGSQTGFYFGTAFGIGTAGQFNDFVTFTSDDPLATTTQVSANLNLSGMLNATIATVSYVEGLWSMDGAGTAFFALYSNSGLSLTNMAVADGIAGVGANHATLRTATFNAPLNQPLRLTLRLLTGAGVAGSDIPVAAISDFGHSFEVPLGTNAFNLPDGVTANAGTWLVNNRRLGPAGGIPEPASWALLIVGFGVVGAAQRGSKVVASNYSSSITKR